MLLSCGVTEWRVLPFSLCTSYLHGQNRVDECVSHHSQAAAIAQPNTVLRSLSAALKLQFQPRIVRTIGHILQSTWRSLVDATYWGFFTLLYPSRRWVFCICDPDRLCFMIARSDTPRKTSCHVIGRLQLILPPLFRLEPIEP
jgi:hypothetical protein